MPDIEKVVKGLECCIADVNEFGDCLSNDCPYKHKQRCFSAVCNDALELLKARIPRVLTLDEIKDGESYWFSAGKKFVPRPVICVRRGDDAQKPYITFAWRFGTFSWLTEDYGKIWRCWSGCWSARPTDEQMEAVK